MKKLFLNRYTTIIMIFVVVFVAGIAWYASTHPLRSFANPGYSTRTQLASATTTVTFLDQFASSGTSATSTLTVNSTGSQTALSDSAAILVQFTGSSTASVLEIQPEYSQDGVDWYAIASTTSALTDPAPLMDGRIEWQFASSTVTAGGSGAGDRAHRIFIIPTPTKYTRVRFYLKTSSLRGSVWAEVVSRQQSP